MPMNNHSLKRIQSNQRRRSDGWNLFYYFTESFGMPEVLAACRAKCDKIALIKV